MNEMLFTSRKSFAFGEVEELWKGGGDGGWERRKGNMEGRMDGEDGGEDGREGGREDGREDEREDGREE